MAKKTNDDVTRNILNTIRNIQEGYTTSKRMINEEKDKDDSPKAIAITDDPKWGQNVLTNQIEEFRSAVEGGATFNKVDESKTSECPLIFIPSTNNLVFSGVIPCLNNLKWQFVLKTSTGNGCFFWVDGGILNKDNLQILNKLFGFYSNWKDQWNKEAADLERMVEGMKNK